MNLSPNSKATVTFSVIGGLLLSGWAASQAFGNKADKSDVDSLRSEVGRMQNEHIRESVIQQNILKLMEKMDSRMQRIEDKQDYMIQESYKRWHGDAMPPASTPAPNPLNR